MNLNSQKMIKNHHQTPRLKIDSRKVVKN